MYGSRSCRWRHILTHLCFSRSASHRPSTAGRPSVRSRSRRAAQSRSLPGSTSTDVIPVQKCCGVDCEITNVCSNILVGDPWWMGQISGAHFYVMWCNVKYICIAPPYSRAVTAVLVLVQKHTNMKNCPNKLCQIESMSIWVGLLKQVSFQRWFKTWWTDQVIPKVCWQRVPKCWAYGSKATRSNSNSLCSRG